MLAQLLFLLAAHFAQILLYKHILSRPKVQDALVIVVRMMTQYLIYLETFLMHNNMAVKQEKMAIICLIDIANHSPVVKEYRLQKLIGDKLNFRSGWFILLFPWC